MIRLGKVALDLIHKLLDTQISVINALLNSNMHCVKTINDTSMSISRINKDLLMINGDKVGEVEEQLDDVDLNEILRKQMQRAVLGGEVREFKYPKNPQQMAMDQDARDKAYKIHLEQIEKWKQQQQEGAKVEN